MSSIRLPRNATVSLFLTYLLVILLCTPFTAAGVRSLKKSGDFGQEISPAPYREGELLVRFREGASQKDRDTIIAAQGARRKKQLNGDSGLEKLELGSGRDARTTALQMLQNPQVQFAEPNLQQAHVPSRFEAAVR